MESPEESIPLGHSVKIKGKYFAVMVASRV